MDEILYELREHSAGLNAGRWDYIFSVIKKLGHRPEFVLPDRAAVTMAVPFMRAYCELLVKTCHRRGAHAMGGMAAFIPSRRDPEVNAVALEKVREDKDREASQGFDGTWVAHPDLVPVALESFDRVLGERPNQIERQRDDVEVGADELLDVRSTPGEVTEDGLRTNVSVGIQYLAAWLRGSGAVAIDNLMEDAATAEISRSQIWQWLRHERFSDAEVQRITEEEVAKLGAGFDDARALFERIATERDYVEFLTLPAYDRLVAAEAEAPASCLRNSATASATSSKSSQSTLCPPGTGSERRCGRRGTRTGIHDWAPTTTSVSHVRPRRRLRRHLAPRDDHGGRRVPPAIAALVAALEVLLGLLLEVLARRREERPVAEPRLDRLVGRGERDVVAQKRRTLASRAPARRGAPGRAAPLARPARGGARRARRRAARRSCGRSTPRCRRRARRAVSHEIRDVRLDPPRRLPRRAAVAAEVERDHAIVR